MPWQSALCFVGAAFIAVMLLALWFSKWREGWEERAIRRAKKRERKAWKLLNRPRGASFNASIMRDWNHR
jgi:hypothetical protein